MISSMTTVMTPTEFNRYPSHASRLAASGEDVVIQRRSGGNLLLTLLDKPVDPVEAAIRSGRATPPVSEPGPDDFPRLNVDPEEALAMLDADRNRLDY